MLEITAKKASSLFSWRVDRKTGLIALAIVFMALAAFLRLSYEFWRLLFDGSRTGAIDLKIFHGLVHEWFDGTPVYRDFSHAMHPPATYLMLWPFLGWLPVAAARWLWAGTTIMATASVAYLATLGTGVKARSERVGVVLFVVSIYATAITIGNGQVILHLLPALLAAIILLQRERSGWARDLLISSLLLFSLLKPSVSVPFFWIVLFSTGALRAFVITSTGYAVLTVWAASFQDEGPVTLIRSWLQNASQFATLDVGYANAHMWLGAIGLGDWGLQVSLIALAALGLWIYWYRRSSIWLLMGVTAIVARLWTYHRLYDDLLILLPMIALFRITPGESTPRGRSRTAMVLLALSVGLMLAPGTLLRSPSHLGTFLQVSQSLVWMSMLALLVDHAWREKRISANPVRPRVGGAAAAGDD